MVTWVSQLSTVHFPAQFYCTFLRVVLTVSLQMVTNPRLHWGGEEGQSSFDEPLPCPEHHPGPSVRSFVAFLLAEPSPSRQPREGRTMSLNSGVIMKHFLGVGTRR